MIIKANAVLLSIEVRRVLLPANAIYELGVRPSASRNPLLFLPYSTSRRLNFLGSLADHAAGAASRE